MTHVNKMPYNKIGEKLRAFHMLVVQNTIPCFNQHEHDISDNYPLQ